MSSNHTPNYGLCQWEADDKVLRTDFNADNAKIDAALAGKASASIVSGLQNSVSGKASQSEVDTLSATVSQHTASLAKKGNCQFYTTTYMGNGTCGAGSPSSLTFPHKPMVVFILRSNYRMTLVQGEEISWADNLGEGVSACQVSCSGKSVQWYSNTARGQMNEPHTTPYVVVALLDAAN